MFPCKTPQEAIDRLEDIHAASVKALRDALARFVKTKIPPTPEERKAFRYPEIRVTYAPDGPPPVSERAYASLMRRESIRRLSPAHAISMRISLKT